MKKLILLAAISAFWAAPGSARESVGCGLGTMLFDGKQGVAPQVMAVTTNGTSGNQTFGISSGTLGCDSNGTITSAEKLSLFTSENLERLAQDMSSGEGETLATFAGLMGVESADRQEFYAETKAGFSRIFTHAATTADEVLAGVRAIMQDNERLNRYVS